MAATPYIPIAKRKHSELVRRAERNLSESGPRLRFTMMMRKFVEAYVTPGEPTFMNGTRAAQYAGYGKKWAHRRANRLMRHPLIREFIDEWLKQQGLSRDRILYQVCQLAYNTGYGDAFKAKDKLAALMFLSKFAGSSRPAGLNTLAKWTGVQVSCGPQTELHRRLAEETRRAQVPGLNEPTATGQTNVQVMQLEGTIPAAGGEGNDTAE